MADKSGGDNTQVQGAVQNTGGVQDQNTVAAGGTAAVDAMGADALSSGMASQYVDSALAQAALAAGGDGGNDNISTNTNINIS